MYNVKDMAKRVKVKGKYMLQREKNTSGGARGTFMGKWSPQKSISVIKITRKAAASTHAKYKNTFKWLGTND